MQRTLVLFLLALLLCSYQIGHDPSWYPNDLSGKTENVNAFVNELVMEISKGVKMPMEIVHANWNSLYRNLGQEYEGVLSGIARNSENRQKYDFSKSFLQLGPVLVVRKGSGIHSLKDLKAKIVGISPYGNDVLIVQKIPSVVIRNYTNIPSALDELASGEIDGVVMANLDAKSLVSQLHSGTLEIITEPLTDEGLFLIVLKGEEKRLITQFNKGLRRLKKSGRYHVLLSKFEVN